MKLIYLTTFFVLIACLSRAQTNASDSATLHAQTSSAYQLYLTHTDSSIQIAKQALEVSKKNGNRYQEARSYLALSKSYWAKANFMLSTDYGFKALKFFENSPYTKDRTLTFLALGRTLTELGNYTKAEELIKQAVDLASSTADSLLLADGFREFSFLFAEQGNYSEALRYSDLGIQLFEKYKQPLDVSILYGRKSRIYFDLKDYVKSREFAYKGMPIDSVTGNLRALSISKFLAAQAEHQFGNRKAALALAKNSIAISESLNNQQWLIRGHQLLATLYKEEGNLLQSNHELTLVSLYKDSLFNAEKSGQAEEMQALYELEAKEKTIQLLANENKLKQQQYTNQRLYVAVLVISVILLIAVISFMLRLRTIQKRANETLSAQKKEIEEQATNLHHLNQLKTKLFSVISHDLRGPVSNLKVLLDMLSTHVMTPEEFIGLSAKLKTNIDNTQQTLENLLNWSLTQMQGIKTEAKEVSLSKAIDQTCNLLTEAAASKAITIRKEISNQALAMVDPNQLQIIIRNLLHNAIKFSKANTAIDISVKPHGTFWKILIQDSGIGMNQEEIDALLNSSLYFSKVGTHQEKGTGLGLLLCKEFIKLNNGKIQIESIPGSGTTIFIYVPQA